MLTLLVFLLIILECSFSAILFLISAFIIQRVVDSATARPKFIQHFHYSFHHG